MSASLCGGDSSRTTASTSLSFVFITTALTHSNCEAFPTSSIDNLVSAPLKADNVDAMEHLQRGFAFYTLIVRESDKNLNNTKLLVWHHLYRTLSHFANIRFVTTDNLRIN
mmetsp:Transcript_31474/g.43686  ORF Transcript_31474/g.43686 Transcript_31474/m.43686 type:complete len:111 (+) Transcript_31474:260-592(+)